MVAKFFMDLLFNLFNKKEKNKLFQINLFLFLLNLEDLLNE